MIFFIKPRVQLISLEMGLLNVAPKPKVYFGFCATVILFHGLNHINILMNLHAKLHIILIFIHLSGRNLFL